MSTTQVQHPANSEGILQEPVTEILIGGYATGQEDGTASIKMIKYLPGGERFITYTDHALVQIWDVVSGNQVGKSMRYWDQFLLDILVTRGGEWLVCVGVKGQFYAWKTREVTNRWAIQDSVHVLQAAVSQDDELLIFEQHKVGETWASVITVREITDGRLKRSTDISGKVDNAIGVCFSPDGKKLLFKEAATGWWNVFDVESGERTVDPIKANVNGPIIWSHDGRRIFSRLDRRSTIVCWDPMTGEEIGTVGYGDDTPRDWDFLTVSPDGIHLASVSYIGEEFYIWDTVSFVSILRQPWKKRSDISALAFSPSGEFLACGDSAGRVTIWRVPGWSSDSRQARDSLLELEAVIPPNPSSFPRVPELDFHDLIAGSPLPTQNRARERASRSGNPPRVQGAVFSWNFWKTLAIPRLTFRDRSQMSPASGPPRVGVASRDSDSGLGDHGSRTTNERRTTDPGGLVVQVEESYSGEEGDMRSDEELDMGPIRVGCCGLFASRWRRDGNASGALAVALSERASDPPHPRGITLPSPSFSLTPPQTVDILDLSAVPRSESAPCSG